LVGDLPGGSPQHRIAKQADLHLPELLELRSGNVGRNISSHDRLMPERKRLGSIQGRRQELMPWANRDVLGNEMDSHARVDDELGHVDAPILTTRPHGLTVRSAQIPRSRRPLGSQTLATIPGNGQDGRRSRDPGHYFAGPRRKP
jgi:hypothetical protein